MKYFKKGIFLFFIILFLASTSVHAKVRVIFYHVENGGGVNIDDIRIFTRNIKKYLRQNAKIDLVSDFGLDQIFEDHGINKAGCTSTACALTIMNDERIGASYAMYGKMYRNEDGMICMEATAVSALKKAIFWETKKIYQVPSRKQINAAAFAIVDEFAENLDYPIRISKVMNNSVFIDAGSDLGITYGQSYYVVNEERIGPAPEDIVTDTLGRIRVTTVNPAFSEAKIIEKIKPFFKYAKVIIEKKPNTPPIIIHNWLKSYDGNSDLTIEAEISDDQQVKMAKIYYKTDNNKNFKSLIMQKKSNEENIYTATIPNFEFYHSKSLFYYIFAKDNSGKTSKLEYSKGHPFKIKIITIDRQAPKIIYSNIDTIVTGDRIIHINPKVIDNVNVKQVFIFYKFQENSKYRKLSLKKWGENSWGFIGRIPKDKNVLFYYLKAEDSNNNAGYFGNELNPYKIEILDEDKTPPKISNIQFHKSGWFGNKFIFSLKIIDNSEIEKAVLHYSMKPRNGMAEKQKYNLLSFTNDDNYQCSIIIDTTIYQSVNFKIEATDIHNNTSVKYYKIDFYDKIKQDHSPPQIMHYYPQNVCIKPNNYQRGGDVIYIVIFDVKDNVGISTVKAYIRKLGTSDTYRPVPIPKIGGHSYGAYIKGPDWGIELFLEAIDSNNNKSYLGSDDNPFKIEIYQNPKRMAHVPKTIEKRL